MFNIILIEIYTEKRVERRIKRVSGEMRNSVSLAIIRTMNVIYSDSFFFF